MCALQFFLWSAPAQAAYDNTPIPYRNQSPIFLQFAGIQPTNVAALPRGAGRFAFTSNFSNIFEYFATTTHEVRIDFEQLRQDFSYAVGLGDNWTFDVNVPLVHTSGGFLDRFVQNYHQMLGLPNGGRNLLPAGQHAFYVRDLGTGADIYRVNPVKMGLGDIDVRLRHATLSETRHRPALGWFVTLEAPTGRKSQGLGNGALDYGFGILADKHAGRWYGFLNAGYFVNGGHAPLAPFVQNELFNWAVGGAYHFSKAVAATAQLQGGTPMLHGMHHIFWDAVPMDVVIGFAGHHPHALGNESFFWQIGFSEDVVANGPSIDFTALGQIGISWDAL